MAEMGTEVIEGGTEGTEPKFVDLVDGKPIERWNDIYGKYKTYHETAKQYSELGDVTEVKSKLQKLQEWEKAVEEQRKNAAMGDDERQAKQREAQIRKELLRVYPELAEIQSLKELRDEIAAMKGEVSGTKMEALAAKASAELSGMLSSAKIDAKYQSKIEDFLFSQMTQEEQKDFAKGDFSRMKEIFEDELNNGLLSAYKRGPKPPDPAVRHKPGGTPPKVEAKKPKTLDEATNDAWSKMSEG